MLFGSEIDLEETAGELAGGFPTNLATEAGFVASTLNGVEVAEKIEEDGFEEVPIFGSDGKKASEPEIGAFGFVNVEAGKIALATGGDIEAQTEGAVGSVGA